MSEPSVITGPHGPASQDLIKWLKGIFGKSFSVSRGFSHAHDGIDLPAREGTPVRAIKSGVVSYARDARLQADAGSKGWAIGGGKVVNIDVGGKLTTQYAHLKSFVVKEGQFVKAGDIIGYVGKTGGTINGRPGGPGSEFVGAHLHFGLWDKNINKQINPQKFLENIGDTSTAAEQVLSNLGISTDPDHKFTDAEIQKLVKHLYGGFDLDGRVSATFVGKDVRWFLDKFKGLQTSDPRGSTGGDPNSDFFGLESALTTVGTQIGDTLTWLGFIFVGIVLIAGGIYLLKPSKDSE